MKRTTLIALLIILLSAGQAGSVSENQLDSRAAFYEGEELNYVIPPPPDFKQVTGRAADDGYSFAFIPDTAKYATADVLIGVNIYKIRGVSFEHILQEDTTSLRKHYGKDLLIWEVDSVFTQSGNPVRTFYMDDKTRFIPNVMISYFSGNTELIIFELVISEHILRVEAEEAFVACLKGFKALKRGELDSQ